MTESVAEFAAIAPGDAIEYAAYVDLDVDADTITVRVTLPGQNAPSQHTEIPCHTQALRKLVESLRQRFGDQPMLWTCEAGRRGYFVYRQLAAQGQECQVVAPGMMAPDTRVPARSDEQDAVALANNPAIARQA